ncbi:MAG: molybdenum cofactor biosynthesis protein [Methanobacteriota archaeon]
MKLRLRLFATPREIVGRPELVLEVPEGTTVAALLDRLVADHPRLAEWREYLLAAVNREYAAAGRVLRDGDEVAVMPPVSGGSQVAVRSEAATIEEVAAMVRDPRAGVVVTFTGIVRGHAGTERVTRLEYEAYPEMAEKELRRLADEATQKFGVLDVAVVHRVGSFRPGEEVVWIAVSSEHREAAFEAAAHLIRELKEFAPIWKKEHTETGAAWKEEGHGGTRRGR